MIEPALAARFARIALGHVRQEYPYKLDHVLERDEDAVPPRVLHPIFHGSFDWHSCVHGYWLLARLLARAPELAEADAIRTLFDEMLTPEKVTGELAYLARASSTGFERPYGWAWLLALHQALTALSMPRILASVEEAEPIAHPEPVEACPERLPQAGSRRGWDTGPGLRQAQTERKRDVGPGTSWAATLEPLARAFAQRFVGYLARLDYPIRTGAHFNTAFALLLARGWAERHDLPLRDLIDAYAREKFGGDRDAQAWEPSGDAFLSPVLVEAALMQAVLEPAEFAAWFGAFLPRLGEGDPAALLTPARVSDRSDGKIAHLDGLNLSRAWCWRRLLPALGDRAAAQVRPAIEAHLAASLPHIADDYAGTHWLATFALMALDPSC